MKNISFKMQRIRIEQFAILSDKLPDKDISINTECGVGVDTENTLAHLRLRLNYIHEQDILLTLTLVCVFAIDKSSWEEMKNSEGKVILPRGFLSHMAVHTVGTARGILFCKTEDTPFQQLILPPINVDEMFTEDLVIES